MSERELDADGCDQYGNSEAEPCRYCSFPDCGCDGARLCMATEGASSKALDGNVEGMWSGKSRKQKEAVFNLMREIAKEKS